MKKISLIFLALCLCLGACLMPMMASATALQDTTAPADTTVPEETTASPATPVVQGSAITEGDASVTHGAASLAGQKPLGGSIKRLETAKAALLYELNTGTLLYTWNPDARMHPASLVKVMTAMVALEEGSLADPVTITSAMLSQLTSLDLFTNFKEGEQLTLGDLVHSCMVTSSNAASALIAIHISGSEASFVSKMNARAKELGCTDTNFVNSHGIPHDSQYTTARDMARILEAALQSEEFRQVFGAETYTIPATNLSEEKELVTTNYFLTKRGISKFYDSRVTGGKSGAASTQDRSIVFTAQSGELNLLGVVMGAEGETGADGSTLRHHGSFEEATVLMNYGFDSFTTAQILFSGKSLAQFQVENSANDIVGRPVSSVSSALPAGTTLEHLSWQYVLDDSLTAPVKKGDVIGAIQVWCGDVCVAQSEMVSMNGARLTDAMQAESDRLAANEDEKDNDGFTQFLMVIGILLGAALVLGALLMILVWTRAAIAQSRSRTRSRRRRQSRRRSR